MIDYISYGSKLADNKDILAIFTQCEEQWP